MEMDFSFYCELSNVYLCVFFDLMVCRAYNKHRDYSNRVYASDEDREEALERAEKLLEDLGSEFPAFTKPMLQSHVSGGFWLVIKFLGFHFFVHVMLHFFMFKSSYL